MRYVLTGVLLVSWLGVESAFAENWPQWRGPLGTGVSTESDLPVRWSAEENIAWKTELRGLAVSNPIVWGDAVFVTSQVGIGTLAEGRHPTLARGEDAAAEKPLGHIDRAIEKGQDRVTFLVGALRRADGSRLWSYELASSGELPAVHSKHNLASPSPVTDGERVYAWFGTGQLVALDMKGRLVWERNLSDRGPFDIHWGHAASPTLYGDFVILLCDHDSGANLVALDKTTGREMWTVDRGPGIHSYSTPFVAAGGSRDELIVNSSERVEAYDPRDGTRLWYYDEANRFPIPVPSYEGGILYMSRGYRSGPYMAVRVGGSGDISKSHIEWRVETGAPYVSSLVQYEGLVYMVNGSGIATSVDAKTGERVWRERLGGIFTASPVAGDGKVYFLAESGEMIVIEAGREGRILSRNSIDERSIASPAVASGQIFLRTDTHLFAVGKAETAVSTAETRSSQR